MKTMKLHILFSFYNLELLDSDMSGGWVFLAVCMCASVYMYTCIHVCISISIYIHVHMCTYVYTYLRVSVGEIEL